MTYRIRVSLLLLGCLAVLALLALLVLYIAVCHMPEFYRRAMDVPQEKLKEGSERMIRRAAALTSDLEKEGSWETLISAEEINGWLAVDMKRNHPDALPEALGDPRVTIDEGGITLACRYEHHGVTSILSLTIVPSIEKDNVLTLRIRGARAGLLPVSLKGVLDRITRFARDMQFHVEWRLGGGDPVALLSLPDAGKGAPTVTIDTLRLGEGEIYIAGTTKQRGRPRL
ncbi:MAG: hypothetical protein JW959_03475 [Pirellulales bacterium]|nr:hypothetical protein [Pirellulales bacterium]